MKKLKGQISLFDIPEYLPEVSERELKERECSTCSWWDGKKNECGWLIYDFEKQEKEKHLKGNCEDWRPNTNLFKCCDTCEYANDFVYEGEDIKHPIDEPNIYCTHREGSSGRYSRWPDRIEKGFGCGTWHRQHEYDICDRWKLDKQWHKDCRQL